MPVRRVLYHYSSTQADTGSPRALLRMIDTLPRDRFEPLYLTSRQGPLIEELRMRGVPLVPGEVESLSWKRPVRGLGAIRAHVRRLREHRVDIVHCNEIGWNSDVVFAARWAGIPVVLHVHNPLEIVGRNLNLSMASRILLCSRYQGEATEHFDQVAARSLVLHNSVDIEKYAGGRDIRASFGFPAGATIIATIGQISHRKGMDVFLDMAARLRATRPSLRFLIVGPGAKGEAEYGRTFDQRLRDEFRDDVRYLGSRTDIPDILASIDLFCFPTRAEPFGMVVTEAMAAGVPVVASSVGGIPEILTTPDIGVLVSPYTVEAFAGAVGTLLDAGGLRELGARGRESLIGRFDSDSMGRRLSAIYDDLVAAAPH